MQRLEVGAQVRAGLAEKTGYDGLFTPYTLDELEALGVDDITAPSVAGTRWWPMGQVCALHQNRYPFLPRRLSADGRFVELVDLLGRRVYYRRQRSLFGGLTGMGSYQRVARSETPFANEPEITPPAADYVAPTDLATFARELTLRQLDNSSTWRDEYPHGRRSIEAGIEEAIVHMLRLLRSEKPLTEDILASWNRSMLSQNPQTERAAISRMLSGRVRGTGSVIRWGGIDQWLDLRGADIPLLYSGEKGVMSDRSEQVLERLRALIADVNRIKKGTSFRDCVLVFRRFIRIHPYLDANGRTGVVLLQYVLMKAGFPPIPGNLNGVRMLLFASEDDAVRAVAALYARPR